MPKNNLPGRFGRRKPAIAIATVAALALVGTFGAAVAQADVPTSAAPSLTNLTDWTQGVDSPVNFDWSTTTIGGHPALRMSNWVSDTGLYGDINELNTPAIASAGEPGTGADYNTFTSHFTVSSKTFLAQPGLAIEVSADNAGNRAGGSVLLRVDKNKQLSLTNFYLPYDATNDDNPYWANVTTTVPFTKPVAITLTDHFIVGGQDIVSVYADGKLVLRGGDYEAYERIENIAPTGQTVDSLLFRAGHTAPGPDGVAWVPATPTASQLTALHNKGLYFTNVSYSSTNSIAVQTPTISGQPSIGTVLTANVDSDVADTTSTYQWYLNGVAVSAAKGTAQTYTVPASAIGKRVSVKVTEAKAGYATGSATSALTSKVDVNSFTSASVSISGTPTVGSLLTANMSSTPASTYVYQWYRGTSGITGATKSTYRVAAADLGSVISVHASANKAHYVVDIVKSAPTAVVTLGSITLGTPVITGALTIGHTVTASATVSGTGITKIYEFYLGDSANGVLLQASTSAAFKIPAYLKGDTLSVVVLAFAPGVTSQTAASAVTVSIN